MKPARPQAARGAAHEERREGHAALAQQGGRARSLPARREGADGRRGGYVMGTANLCRSCGLAVWLAGKDAHGRWVKVNLDGSPHICGLPMTGLGRIPMPLALPPGPQALAPLPAAYQGAPPSMWPAPQPVADQGRVWVERFMVGVALVALLYLATIPRDVRSGLSGPRVPALQSAVQPVGIAPASASPARPDPPKKDAFSLGSTEDDVMAVMGPPREIHDNRWWYGSSYVDFRSNRVVNFYNSIHGELKVKIQGAARSSQPTYLVKGLTKDEVLNLQGTPTRLAGNRWYYGSSYVDFREERVADYFNGVLRELKLPARSLPQ
jgi:outer membrane protein assembly factor BamE (lipoprotein component of BamABCDE complex)